VFGIGIRIRPDPKLFGLKDSDPKLLILARIRMLLRIRRLLRIRILPFFTPNLEICFKNVLKSEQIIIISYTILE
jgi:hypothetical protein